MNNYRKFGALSCMLMLCGMAWRPAGPGREKIKSLKVAFITQQLNLSTAEAQVFWPIYNEHEQELESLKIRERRELKSRLRDMGALSDSEARDLLSQIVALEQEKQELNIDFLNEVSRVLSPRKTLLLIKAEEEFKRRLLREIQQRRRGG